MQPVMVHTSSTNKQKLIVRAALVIGAIVVVAFLSLALYWPFRRSAVLKQLEDASLSRVNAAAFHKTYFPRPGCVLEHVTFQHDSTTGSPPLIAVDKLSIEGSFSGLFVKHVKLIRAEGMHIVIPPRGAGERFQTPQRSTIVIDELIADGAVLEVSREADKQALKFSFHSFDLSNIGSNGPASFQAKFSNPEPPGEITASGKFGPWSAEALGTTAVSGEYWFQQADLGVFHGIAGLLSSSGKFSGVIDHIEVQGQTDVPNFAVTSSFHQVQLRTQFHAVVNGENGDTFLQCVDATFLKTNVSSQGSVAGQPGQPGKTTAIELTTNEGRIQDLLLLFVQAKQAPMSGFTSFHAKVSIPPGARPFLKKVELQGDFGVNGSFTKSSTQQGVNRLSEGALFDEKGRREPEKNDPDPETVLSNLKGHVVLKDGTAKFFNLSFGVPGASAQMQGSYNLITEKINLHGTLITESQPSKTTSGVKAAMLKVLSPFVKRKPAGYVLPIKITGTYDHPLFGLDLMNDNKKPQK